MIKEFREGTSFIIGFVIGTVLVFLISGNYMNMSKNSNLERLCIFAYNIFI